MKVTILVPFRDKHDHKVVYSPGEVKEFDNDRAVALATRGLVKPLETEAKTDAEAEEKPAKKSKGKGKSTKKAKDETPKTEVVEAEVDNEAEVNTEAEADEEATDVEETDND